jgi:hypothetical protein
VRVATPWFRAALISTLVALAVAPAACGSDDEASAPPATTTAAVATTTAEPAPQPAPGSACREPTGQEKVSLRFAVRAHDGELKDEPWALVRRRGVNYMAAEIDAPDIDLNTPLVVLVSFSEEGKYLSGMKAINGTARTFTDLPNAGDMIPKGGEQALSCVTE